MSYWQFHFQHLQISELPHFNIWATELSRKIKLHFTPRYVQKNLTMYKNIFSLPVFQFHSIFWLCQ
jgi:hypothetical protein